MEKFEHTGDYRIVWYRGKEYRLTEPQAAVVRFLHECYKKDKPDYEQNYLVIEVLDKPGDYELKTVFRSRLDAWRDLFIREGGCIRLKM